MSNFNSKATQFKIAEKCFYELFDILVKAWKERLLRVGGKEHLNPKFREILEEDIRDPSIGWSSKVTKKRDKNSLKIFFLEYMKGFEQAFDIVSTGNIKDILNVEGSLRESGFFGDFGPQFRFIGKTFGIVLGVLLAEDLRFIFGVIGRDIKEWQWHRYEFIKLLNSYKKQEPFKKYVHRCLKICIERMMAARKGKLGKDRWRALGEESAKQVQYYDYLFEEFTRNVGF